MKNILREIATVALASGCGASSQVWVAEPLAPEVSDYDTSMARRRMPLELSTGSVTTCQGYVQGDHRHPAETVSNQAVLSEYLVCDVLAALGGTHKLGSPPEGNYGQALATRLDLRSFRSSLGPRVSDEAYTVVDLFPNSVTTKQHEADASADDWSFRLTLVAVADVDRSGHPDWLVWVSDEALDGNYRGYATLLLRDPKPSGALVAEEL